MNLLFQCEEKLKGDWIQYDAGTASGNLIEKLHLLETGRTGAHEVAVSSLDFWFRKLENADTVLAKSEEPMISLVEGLFSPEEVVSAGENKNIVVPFYSKIIARVDRLKEWFEFTPKFAYAMAASLVVIIIPLLFLLREPVPLSLQISMVAYQETLLRSDQKEAIPITVNKGVTLSADDCIRLHLKPVKIYMDI